MLQSFQYHKEQIETLVKTKLGAVATNVIAPVLFFLFFQDIPINLLYFLTASFFTVFIFRISIGSNLKKILYIADDSTIEKELKKYLFILFLSALLWAIATILAVMYSDTLHIFILLTALICIISAGMATIGSIYHAIFIYIIIIIPAFIFSLSYFGNSSYSYITSASLLLYMYVMLRASFKNYKLLENSISQKEKIELLNKSLEEKVKKAVEETQKKEKLLQQQAHLAQMGEMISMIAHQWRQPLGSISSTIIDLQVKLQLDTFNLEDKEGVDSMIKYMDKKHENIIELLQFLSTTINDFRDFFKPDKAKKFITLTTPINKTLQIIESSLLNNNIEIIKDFQIDDELSLYQNEMTQVILNILKNSEDNFLEKNILNPKITISTQEEHGTYIISISDNGGGIPEDILPNIFNPYFSTKDEKNGTGLGLYMSKTMIEKHHGGKLRVYNTEDGVIFKIILYTKDYKEQCIFDEL